MGIILENYEKIVKNIVSGIVDGTIVSHNAHNFQGKSAKELFRMFSAEFDFKYHQDKIITGLTIENDLLGIPIPENALNIISMRFNDIGVAELPENVLDNKAGDKLYLDLQNTDQNITPFILIHLSYISFNTIAGTSFPEEVL